MSHAELIERLGNPTKLAPVLSERLGKTVTRPAVAKWKKFRVPYRYRAKIAQICAERGIPLPADWYE